MTCPERCTEPVENCLAQNERAGAIHSIGASFECLSLGQTLHCCAFHQKDRPWQLETPQPKQPQRPSPQFGAQVPGQANAIRRVQYHAHLATAVVQVGDLGLFEQPDQPPGALKVGE